MFIKDLQPRQTDVDVEAEVTEISEPREFNKQGKQGKVANAIIKDPTGTVKLSLWNEQIDKLKKGDRIKIEKGYVNEWQGELQLTTGKFGTIEVISSAEKEEKTEPKAPPTSKKEEPRKEMPDDFEIEEEDMN